MNVALSQLRPASVGLDISLAWPPVPRHASEEEYAEYVRRRQPKDNPKAQAAIAAHMTCMRRFVRSYPSLEDWFSAPLAERIGCLCGESKTSKGWPRMDNIVSGASYNGRSYLYFLAVRGYAAFDLEWLVALPAVSAWSHLNPLGLGAEVERLVDEAEALGYAREPTTASLKWCLSRLYMHTLDPNPANLKAADVNALEHVILSFAGREDRDLFFGSEDHYRSRVECYGTSLHLLRVLLYHRDQSDEEPRRRTQPKLKAATLGKPDIQATISRYLARRRLTSRPNTIRRIDRGLRLFAEWLEDDYPEVDSFAEVARDHILDFLEAMEEMPGKEPGANMAVNTRRNVISALSIFFQDTADWDWDGVPRRQLVALGDMPKVVEKVPRYIPEDQLGRIMETVRDLECPLQRAAILIARWSGARSGEIRLLEIDCLDSYPDGTPRLRIPPGKSRRERVVPVTEEAADAIHTLQKDRSQKERGLRDDLTGEETRRLFLRLGKLPNRCYLFDHPLADACRRAGLVDNLGRPTISPHRFRHTVGHQLAEKGARLQTIMSVLGHLSPEMSIIYARISDKQVLNDYKAVLAPGAEIAGPLAETIRNGELPSSDVEWIKTNFFETELELGRCLRLPQEGPCECDLFLTCPKFVTAKEYSPRLRERMHKELILAETASENGWGREIERHRCTARRVERLLEELGEPADIAPDR